VSDDSKRSQRLWPLAWSVFLHLTAVGVLLMIPNAPLSPRPAGTRIQVSLVDPPIKRPPAKPAEPTPPKPPPPKPDPKPETAPAPKPVARKPVTRAPVRTAQRPQPRPSRPVVRPTPRPTPTPKPDQVAILRKYPAFKDLTDKELRKLQLPPGLKSWAEFAKLATDIGLFHTEAPPPTTGEAVRPAPPSDVNSDPVWQWRQGDGQQSGTVTWWGGKATIFWRQGDAAATGMIVPDIPEPSPVAFAVPLTPASDRDSVATVVLRILREFQRDGDADARPSVVPPMPGR
jgi:outer membrane biosynthesis protein TonB